MCAARLVGIGETIPFPALRPLINDLAPEALRGRYNAATSLAFTTAAPAGLQLPHGLVAQPTTGSIAISGLAAVLRLPASAKRMARTLRR
ncbi:hypothetical protein Sme01_21050 [Sphaerisporangium melleum]|uniref:Uncharacterized protein n=1 Tax=Sphaerisporangium melleum TaxID=321316 RepID=A0A917RND7_9ACTN|nr:hypothetical protein [Sphaerisporangium melleum]GGL15890.1 hypothetical protein GCM10007964_67350 [Sphaerisporangium melleum]GII69629.1 hypothetical protein Sme01_21050 [Sphaerisporangium melleum]